MTLTPPTNKPLQAYKPRWSKHPGGKEKCRGEKESLVLELA
jgi:hypothetical protein